MSSKWKISNKKTAISVANLNSVSDTSKLELTKEFKNRIATILLSKQFNLLALLCHSTFVGDTAALISSAIISLVRQISNENTDYFVKKLLRTKILIYLSRGRKMNDLLRDNSMSTMVLTAFTRAVGMEYLKTTLSEPLQEVIQSTLKSNGDLHAPTEESIIAASQMVLDSILLHQKQMPREFKFLCSYLRNEIEELKNFPLPVKVKTSNTQNITGQLVTTLSLDSAPSPSMRERKTSSSSLKKLSFFIQKRSDVQPDDSMSPKPPERKSSATGFHLDSLKKGKKPSLPSLNTPDLEQMKKAEKMEQEIKQKLEDLDKETPPASTDSPITQTKSNENIKSKVENEKDDSFFTPSERCVGCLIFLRFFVPAITAPDSFGIYQGKLDNFTRKGLIQTGKLLNGFFSEADFKQKEGGATYMNDFIDKHKDRVKNFVSQVTVISRSPSNQNLKLGTIREIETPWDLEVDEHLVSYLSKTLTKIETDLLSLIQIVPEQESDGVLESFYELKKELNELQTPTSDIAQRGPSLFSRWTSKITKINMANKSKSSDDVRTFSMTKNQTGEPRAPGPDRKNKTFSWVQS